MSLAGARQRMRALFQARSSALRGGQARAVVQEHGFTLVEVIVAVGIMLLLAGLITPMSYRFVAAQRADTTNQKARQVNTAIRGSGKAFHGFVGDIGRLPLTLTELVSNPNSLPAYAVDPSTGVGSGWRGPYLPQGPTGEDPLADAWGVAFAYNATTGQVTSLGADHVANTADDIKLPDPAPATAQITGTVLATVYVNSIPNPTGLAVTVWDTSNGAQVAVSPIAGVPGYAYTLSQGMHAVKAVHTGTALVGTTTTTFTASQTVPILVLPNSQVKVRVDLTTNANVSSQ